MRAANARRTSGSRVRGIADKDNKWWDVRGAETPRPTSVELHSTDSRGAAVPTQIVTRRSGHADAAAFPQLYYLVEHAVRNFPFRGLGNLDHFAVRNNRDRK